MFCNPEVANSASRHADSPLAPSGTLSRARLKEADLFGFT